MTSNAKGPHTCVRRVSSLPIDIFIATLPREVDSNRSGIRYTDGSRWCLSRRQAGSAWGVHLRVLVSSGVRMGIGPSSQPQPPTPPRPPSPDATPSTPADRLLDIVYDELRALASAYLRNERPDHTLQTTALV